MFYIIELRNDCRTKILNNFRTPYLPMFYIIDTRGFWINLEFL